jgi:co-chaperonin GroES (HSP10)
MADKKREPRAYGDNILLKPSKAPKKIGSIHIPGADDNLEYKCRGFVKYMGPGVEGIEVGDEIIFKEGASFVHEGQTYIIIDTKKIMVIL